MNKTRHEDVLLPLPQMDVDPVRRDLDEAVASALGPVSEYGATGLGELVASVRRQLAMEPSVTGRRYESLRQRSRARRR